MWDITNEKVMCHASTVIIIIIIIIITIIINRQLPRKLDEKLVDTEQSYR